MNIRKFAKWVGAVVMAASAGFANANLVTNGGFETGDLTGWSEAGCISGVSTSFGGYTASGTYLYFGGCIGGLSTVSQTIATVAGQSYTFSFLYGSDGGTPNEFFAVFDGNTVFHTLNDVSSGGLVTESFSVVASGASTVISFSMRNDPSYQALDDVSVTATVPEPGSLALLGLALLGAGVARRRRA